MLMSKGFKKVFMETDFLQCNDTKLTSYRVVICSPVERSSNLKSSSLDFKACALFKNYN